MSTNEYPAFDRLAQRGEMIVSADVINGPASLADLREFLAHALPEGWRIEHDPQTDEIVIRTGLVEQLGGELFLLDDEPAAGPGYPGPCPEGMDWSAWLAMNNVD
jgi:hypothetical protein